jgi:hypothetical protein
MMQTQAIRISDGLKPHSGVPKPLRPPKSAKNGKKQFQPGFCVQKTNELINIELNNEEKFKAKKYLKTNSSTDSYDNIQEIDKK